MLKRESAWDFGVGDAEFVQPATMIAPAQKKSRARKRTGFMKNTSFLLSVTGGPAKMKFEK